MSIRQINVLAEERLDSGDISGVADLLEEDEEEAGKYILTDYKTFASFKVAKCLGRKVIDVPALDEAGNEVIYKSGKKKGQVKTRKLLVQDDDAITKCQPRNCRLTCTASCSRRRASQSRECR
jgi:hypothetical protein